MEENRSLDKKRVAEIVREFLKYFSFFNILSTEELSIIASYLDFFEIEAGKVVFREGDEGDAIYFVVEGELDVIKDSVSGSKVGVDKVVISKMSKGYSIGEMSIIDNVPRSATVRASTRSTLVALTREGFNIILDEYPKIGIKILKGLFRILSKNLRRASGQLADYTLTWSKLLGEANQEKSE
ncbi:MAG: cyclic nucleotide-binding domain-containing protein [Pseudomonadota bacterium]